MNSVEDQARASHAGASGGDAGGADFATGARAGRGAGAAG